MHRSRARGALVGLATAALTLGAVTAPGTASDADGPTLVGVVEEVVVDHLPDAGHGAHGHVHDHPAEDLATELVVDVGGALLDLPPADAAELEAGDAVIVRLADAPPAAVGPAPDLRDAEVRSVEARDAQGIGPSGTRPSANPTAAATAGRGADAAPPGSGTVRRTVLVLPVHVEGTAPDPATQAELRVVARESAEFWTEQSDGRLTMTSEVRESRAVPQPTECRPVELWNAAIAAHGVRPAELQHVAVHLPAVPACAWVGLATIGGGKIWMNGMVRADVLAHEIGHNLRLGHANVAECVSGGTAVTLSATCAVREYHDAADVMGFSTGQAPGSLSAAFAHALGLLHHHDASPVGAVTVDVAPLQDLSGVRALRVVGRDGRSWFVEHRPATGRDTRVPEWAGVQLRELSPDLPVPTTRLVLGRPEVAQAALLAGTELAIPGSGYTLRVVAADDDGARLQVWPTGDVPPSPDAEPGGPVAPAPVRPSFTDVALDHPFHLDVEWLARSGVAAGYPDGTFRPSRQVSRDAMAAFLHRLSGEPGVAYRRAVFTDVPVAHPFHGEIAWLAATGVTTGHADGSFGTGRAVSRAAMAAFLHRYAGSPEVAVPARSPFSDVATTDPFYREIVWLAQSGITTGYPDGTFRPSRPVKRDSMAAFLHRLDALG